MLKQSASDFIMFLTRGVWPPENPTLVSFQDWAKRITVAVLVVAAFSLAATSAAYGLIPHVPGFVPETRMESTEHNLQLLVKVTLSQNVWALRQRQCKMQGDKTTVTQLLYQNMEEYRDRVGEPFNLPPCSEF